MAAEMHGSKTHGKEISEIGWSTAAEIHCSEVHSKEASEAGPGPAAEAWSRAALEENPAESYGYASNT